MILFLIACQWSWFLLRRPDKKQQLLLITSQVLLDHEKSLLWVLQWCLQSAYINCQLKWGSVHDIFQTQDIILVSEMTSTFGIICVDLYSKQLIITKKREKSAFLQSLKYVFLSFSGRAIFYVYFKPLSSRLWTQDLCNYCLTIYQFTHSSHLSKVSNCVPE